MEAAVIVIGRGCYLPGGAGATGTQKRRRSRGFALSLEKLRLAYRNEVAHKGHLRCG